METVDLTDMARKLNKPVQEVGCMLAVRRIRRAHERMDHPESQRRT